MILLQKGKRRVKNNYSYLSYSSRTDALYSGNDAESQRSRTGFRNVLSWARLVVIDQTWIFCTDHQNERYPVGGGRGARFHRHWAGALWRPHPIRLVARAGNCFGGGLAGVGADLLGHVLDRWPIDRRCGSRHIAVYKVGAWIKKAAKWKKKLDYYQGEKKISTEQIRTEEYQIDGDQLVAKVKELVHEGHIRRITVKNKEGKTLIEIPLTFGVVGALLLPVWAALGAIAALVTNCTIVVEKLEKEENE